MNKLYCLLLLFSLSTVAQQNEKSLAIKLDVPQLADFFTFPVIKLSVEKRITPVFSITAGGGYQLYGKELSATESDTVFYKPRGFKIDIEGRVYLSNLLHPETQKQGGFFGGIQLFYRQNQHDAKLDGIKVVDENGTSTIPIFGVKRKSVGVNLTAGFQKNFSHFLFEPSIGLGVMNRNVKNASNDKEALANYSSSGTDLVPFFDKLNLEKSSGTAFNLSLSFKIGYNF